MDTGLRGHAACRILASAARIRYRQPNLKNGAAPRRTAHFNRPGMDFGNPAADGEPQSDSSQFTSARLIRAIESLKHIRQIRLGNANSSVAHFRYRVAVIPLQRYLDLPA